MPAHSVCRELFKMIRKPRTGHCYPIYPSTYKWGLREWQSISDEGWRNRGAYKKTKLGRGTCRVGRARGRVEVCVVGCLVEMWARGWCQTIPGQYFNAETNADSHSWDVISLILFSFWCIFVYQRGKALFRWQKGRKSIRQSYIRTFGLESLFFSFFFFFSRKLCCHFRTFGTSSLALEL